MVKIKKNEEMLNFVNHELLYRHEAFSSLGFIPRYAIMHQ